MEIRRIASLLVSAVILMTGVIVLKMPSMNANQEQTMKLPALTGGINRQEFGILDHQLADAENMWHHDGALRTRPGLLTDATKRIARQYSETSGYITSVIKRKTSISKIGNCVYCFLSNEMSIEQISSGARELVSCVTIGKIGEDGNVKGMQLIDGFSANETDAVAASYDGTYDCYIMGNQVYGVKVGNDYPQEIDPYIPLVFTYGKPGTYGEDANGTVIDDYNVMTNKYQCKFKCDGVGIYFKIPNLVSDCGDLGISVNGTALDGITYDASYSSTQNGYVWHYERNRGTIYRTNTNGTALPLPKDTEVLFTVNDPYFEGYEFSVSEMSIATWYGGDRSGINGGTRLFMAGSDTHKNLLIWSDVNNPLYFPEHNYAYIGDAGSKITALEQMGSVLIVFKEDSIYAIDYAKNSVTADDIINYNISGIQSSTAYFPVTPVHPSIGCRYPKSICLCNNRLVWFDGGKVYGLYAANQYSERNVVVLSNHITLPTAPTGVVSAAEYEQHYLLKVGSDIWAMKYASSGVNSYLSYGDDEKAQHNIPWFKWAFASNIMNETTVMINMPQEPLLLTTITGETSGTNKPNEFVFSQTFSGDRDFGLSASGSLTSSTIHGYFVTKPYDLGAPERTKNVESVYIMCKGGLSVQTIEDDAPSCEHFFYNKCMRPILYRPNRRRVLTFQMKLSGESFATMDIKIGFRTNGGTR